MYILEISHFVWAIHEIEKRISLTFKLPTSKFSSQSAPNKQAADTLEEESTSGRKI